MIHCLPLAWGVPVAQDPGKVSLGWQKHPLCHDFCIWLQCHVFCGAFQKCLAEPSGVIVCGLRTCVYVAVVVQAVASESHLPGSGCDKHVGFVIFCAGEGLYEMV